MSQGMWAVFVLASLAAAFSPGPGVLLAVSNAANLGARNTLYSSAGNATGVFTVAVAAATGVGLLVRSSPLAFGIIKLAGAGYMVWLGVRQWRGGALKLAQAQAMPPRALYRQGLLVALSNPKSILFFTALFAQFAAPDPRLFLALTLTFVACTIASHLFYVLLAVRARRLAPGGRLFGVIFIAFGLGMLVTVTR